MDQLVNHSSLTIRANGARVDIMAGIGAERGGTSGGLKPWSEKRKLLIVLCVGRWCVQWIEETPDRTRKLRFLAQRTRRSFDGVMW